MLIDTFEIIHSGRAHSEVVIDPDQERLIVSWSNLLESCGWTTTDTISAVGSVTYPLGAPVTAGVDIIPKTVVGCNTPPGILTIGNQEYSLYDPFVQIPGSTTDCHFVEMGLTAADTLGNLVDAINTDAVWFAVLVHVTGVNYRIDVTATTGGPLFNEIKMDGNIITGSTITYGGGYRMVSANDTSSTQFAVTLTCANRGGAGDDYLNGLLKFDFEINGTVKTFQLLNNLQGTKGFFGALGVGAVLQYTITACPYGFAIFDLPHDTNPSSFRTISLFCMAPYFPTTDVPDSETFVPGYAVFVIGPNQIGGSPEWHNGPSTMALDDNAFDTFSSNPTARLLSLRAPLFPLYTIFGVPIFLCPYVMFGSRPTNSDHAWVVGKLWDCALVTDYVAEGADLDGKDFLAIGHSDGSGAKTFVTFMMDAGTVGIYPRIAQSARCAASAGNPGHEAYENTGH